MSSIGSRRAQASPSSGVQQESNRDAPLLANIVKLSIVLSMVGPVLGGDDAIATPGQSSLCIELRDALAQRQIGRSSPELDIDGIGGGGGDFAYIDVDIDGDGRADELVQSCGSFSNPVCTIFVKLSGTGRTYEYTAGRFFVIAWKRRYYVLEGESLSIPDEKKIGTRKLTRLDRAGPSPVCRNV